MTDTTRTTTTARGGPVQSALDDFEKRLGSRTTVPETRLGELMQWPEEKLRRESAIVSQTLRRFAEAVVDCMENPESANRFLRELDLKSISRDHDWRAIFSTIRAQEAGYEGYKRAVLIKYLQYLSFRKRLVEYVCAGRRGLEETDDYSDLTLFALRFTGETAEPQPPGRVEDPDYIRLPLGESVDLELPHGREIRVMLAAHVMHLRGEFPPTLTDQNGVTYVFKQGRNMVGRHPEGDVVIDPNFGDVSRAHLIMEWDGAHRIRLIDFSSRGTFVHRGALSSPADESTVPRD